MLLSHMDIPNITSTRSKKLTYEVEEEIKRIVNDAILEADFDAKRNKRRKGLPAPTVNSRIDDVRVMIVQREVGPLHVRMEKVRRDMWPLLDQAVGRFRKLKREGKSTDQAVLMRLLSFLGFGTNKVRVPYLLWMRTILMCPGSGISCVSSIEITRWILHRNNEDSG